VPVLVCLRSSHSHVTYEVGGLSFVRLTPKVVMENGGDFLDVILLCFGRNVLVAVKSLLLLRGIGNVCHLI